MDRPLELSLFKLTAVVRDRVRSGRTILAEWHQYQSSFPPPPGGISWKILPGLCNVLKEGWYLISVAMRGTDGDITCVVLVNIVSLFHNVRLGCSKPGK